MQYINRQTKRFDQMLCWFMGFIAFLTAIGVVLCAFNHYNMGAHLLIAFASCGMLTSVLRDINYREVRLTKVFPGWIIVVGVSRGLFFLDKIRFLALQQIGIDVLLGFLIAGCAYSIFKGDAFQPYAR